MKKKYNKNDVMIEVAKKVHKKYPDNNLYAKIGDDFDNDFDNENKGITFFIDDRKLYDSFEFKCFRSEIKEQFKEQELLFACTWPEYDLSEFINCTELILKEEKSKLLEAIQNIIANKEMLKNNKWYSSNDRYKVLINCSDNKVLKNSEFKVKNVDVQNDKYLYYAKEKEHQTSIRQEERDNIFKKIIPYSIEGIDENKYFDKEGGFKWKKKKLPLATIVQIMTPQRT